MEASGQLVRSLLEETTEAATRPTEIARSLLDETIQTATALPKEPSENQIERDGTSEERTLQQNSIQLLREESVCQSNSNSMVNRVKTYPTNTHPDQIQHSRIHQRTFKDLKEIQA